MSRIFRMLHLVLLFVATPLHAQATFVDKTAELEVQPANAAACWADFDNDGWVDLCAGAVWKNEQGKKFSKGFAVPNAVAADFDNDGLVDIFSWSSRQLFKNLGEMKFEPFALPELPKASSQGACWGDFNNDGFVDLFVGGYEDWNAGITWPYVVLINQQGKSFKIAQTAVNNRSRGVTACDFDEDGDLDVYVSNYRLQPNVLWLNDSKGAFTDVAAERSVQATSPGFGGGHSIGAAWGDFNNDGRFDLFAGNFAHVDNRGDQPKSRFLENLGPDQGFKFKDLGPCGVHYQESYATPSLADYDNDGVLDLFFTTVYGVASFGRPNNAILFRSTAPFQVVNVTSDSKLPALPPTSQAAWADYDNDGDLDLATAGKIFANMVASQGSGRHFLKVRLRGDGKSVNRSAIGAQVRVKLDDRTLTRQVEAGTGEGNQNDLTLHFGLGQHKAPVTLEVTWPGCGKQTIAGVAVDQRLDVNFEGGG